MKNLLELYEQMLTIRLLEDRLQALCDSGLAGDLHFNKGQEAIAVGVCAAIWPQDHIITHHRTIAHQVARGARLYPLVAELLGKRTGTNGGQAGEMHISDPEIRHAFSFQLVGTCIPVATGLAWALKNHWKRDEVVVVFFGDAASSNGQFHEGLSIAQIHKLPILFVVENNNLAGNIQPKHYMPVPTVSERAAGYGIGTWSANGNDVEKVIETTRVCMQAIRGGGGPRLVEFKTNRLCWHKQGQRDVRSAEELAELAKAEPLIATEKIIRERLDVGLDVEVTKKRLLKEIEEAISRAESDLPPEVFHD
jgi:TPP-dependent pyruvate/acetoin dehydrogenase alpha subunit